MTSGDKQGHASNEIPISLDGDFTEGVRVTEGLGWDVRYVDDAQQVAFLTVLQYLYL